MLLLDRIRAAGVRGFSSSFGRKVRLSLSVAASSSSGFSAGGPAGNRKSGIGFGDILGDRRRPMPGVEGAVEERLCWAYLSGGYDAVYRGDVIFRDAG